MIPKLVFVLPGSRPALHQTGSLLLIGYMPSYGGGEAMAHTSSGIRAAWHLTAVLKEDL